MKAYAIESFGGAEVFKMIEVPRPQVKPGFVLIRVKASSVNPVDYKIRRGSASILAPQFPAILHGDVAGIVEEVGEETQFQKGDEVFGYVGGITATQGATAEFVLADTKLIAKKPASLSFEEAAALPLVTITAWEALVDRIKIKMGDQVLIHGGAGGTGHIAIQLAKLQGAKVYTTVSSDEKAEIAKSLGADVVINYKRESTKEYLQKYTQGRGFDVVFDTVGGDTLTQSFEEAAVNGSVASIANTSTHDLSILQMKGLSFHAVFMLIPLIYNRNREHHGEIMRRVAELVDAKKLRPWLDSQRFGFDEVSQAHRKLEAGKAIGKVVLVNRD